MAQAPSKPESVEQESKEITTPAEMEVSPPVKSEHGAQVILKGAPRAAARGGASGDMGGNMAVQHQAIGAGDAADGTTPDASTVDGRLPPDVMDGADQPAYSDPGMGEGKDGFRPGDEKIAKVKAEVAAERAKK